MMKKSKLFIISTSILAVILAVAVPIFAWFVSYRTSIFLVTGDIEIQVAGWFQVAPADAVTDGVLGGWDDPLRAEPLLSFEALASKMEDYNEAMDVESNQIVAFKFEVVNKSEKDALLSMRFSDLSKNIFENFKEYYTKNGVVSPELKTKIDDAAQANTAKLAFFIDNLYYEDSAGTITKIVAPDNDLWKYLAGQNIFEEVPLLGFEYILGVKTEKPINLYFMLSKTQSTMSIDEYRKWLCGDSSDPSNIVLGFGQEVCAKTLGYFWEALPLADKALVDGYLSYFFDSEIRSINPDDADLSILNLDIKYFEFIGENVA